MNKKITVLDLFSGCGGLTEGFFDKSYDFVGHIEMDKYASESLKTRILFHYLKKKKKLDEYYKYLKGDLNRDELIKKYGLETEINKVYNSEISDETSSILIEKIKKNLKNNNLGILIGGPPCQTYSQIGRARVGEKISGDKRNFLYIQYAKFLEELKPEIFVFENVPGLRSAGKGKYFKDMQELFNNVGYEIETSNKIEQYMPDYGIPQNRRRLIIIGWKKGSKVINEYPNFNEFKKNYNYTVNDFLYDLKTINDTGGKEIMGYANENKLLEELGIRDPNMDFVHNHITRPIRDIDKEIYKIVVNKYENGEKLKYADLPKNLQTHKNTKTFQNRFNVVRGKDKITSTIVAHLSSDGHYYVHPDLKQNRSITIREAARLQTFPDNFKFEGPRTAVFKQIGNAVPPMFSKIIANKLKKYF